MITKEWVKEAIEGNYPIEITMLWVEAYAEHVASQRINAVLQKLAGIAKVEKTGE